MSTTIDFEIMYLLRARRYFEEKILEIDKRLRQITKTYDGAIPMGTELRLPPKVDRT